MFRWLAALTVFLMSLAISAETAVAQTVAKVVGVSDNARVERKGKRLQVTQNMSLQNGDRIITDASGQVQIVFVDRTRMLVGPASELRVQNVRMTSGNKARKFAVRALGGSFRMLSGDSPKSAYRIRTPSVTMGIRGTEFDFVVASRRRTDVVAYGGEVQVCNRQNRCTTIIGGCDLVSVQRSRLEVPVSSQDRLNLLALQFPFAAGQQRLPRRFRTPTAGCGDVEQAARSVAAAPSRASVPARTEPAPSSQIERPNFGRVQTQSTGRVDSFGEAAGRDSPSAPAEAPEAVAESAPAEVAAAPAEAPAEAPASVGEAPSSPAESAPEAPQGNGPEGVDYSEQDDEG